MPKPSVESKALRVVLLLIFCFLIVLGVMRGQIILSASLLLVTTTGLLITAFRRNDEENQ